MNKKTQQFLNEADEFVSDLENKPEERMLDVMVGDQVIFLKRDADETATDKDGNPLYNFGVAVVSSVEDNEGNHKDLLTIKKVKKLHLKSDSYPFELDAEVKHILRNYTAEERR